MSQSTLQDMIDDRTQFMPYTVEKYHRMIETGIINEGEPFELLNGQVVRKDRSAAGEDPMTVGHEHAWVVTALEELNDELRERNCYMRIQQPLTLAPSNEPEPDACIVYGNKNAYRSQHPNADSVICVIEVADASLHRDRTIKLRIYAAAGIADYVIINLIDRCVEVYTSPDKAAGTYRKQELLKINQEVHFPSAAGPLAVAVKNLLP